MKSLLTATILLVVLASWGPSMVVGQESPPAISSVSDSVELTRESITAALPLIEKASIGSAENRMCFTCHSQAMPVFTLAAVKLKGFEFDQANFERQVDHTYAHLKRGRKSYAEGKGQGGQVDTAGYALWTLEEGERAPDRVTDAVISYLLKRQKDSGQWACSSNRPPSEVSDFTTTYLAVRALHAFGDSTDQLDESLEQASNWIREAEPKETEDLVFQLLTCDFVDVDSKLPKKIVSQILSAQNEDGGWGQKPDMESDAYATGSVLYALHRSGGLSADDPAWSKGKQYLLETQLDDGSWKVVSRSDPFQKYFETGFPHGPDQFISTMASCWAVLALCQGLPNEDLDHAAPRERTPANTKNSASNTTGASESADDDASDEPSVPIKKNR